ncbi:CYTH-like domain-containing protein [Chaetomidium leptoderma]|uniref:CYTH-like domain-containing protein n=1 Tax=Chaetomidium leptoderma TaxID=669021 RepID=A0AAN6VUH7_9PEZI|nr:CYTH-like domain-containing protein [Chaetomidium leptoderma]
MAALRATRALLNLNTLPLPHHHKPTTNNNNNKTKKTTILEVERKFRRLTIPTLTNLTPILRPQHSPPFASVTPLPTRTIHDIYYDTPAHTLCNAGAYIRRRDGAWQAKIRRGGDYVNSRFEELRGASAVGRCVAGILASSSSFSSSSSSSRNTIGTEVENFGLGVVLAEFVTTREAWLVDGEFKVVRDRMDFGHEVGEVELQVEVEVTAQAGKGLVMMEEMDRRIEGFMKRYAWAWETGEAVGKLSAYFEMMERKRGGKV